MWGAIGPLVGVGGGSDSERIASAMAYGVSRHKEQRGKGPANILELVQGILRIGCVSSAGGDSTNTGGDGTERSETRSSPIHGTLIEWDLHLS